MLIGCSMIPIFVLIVMMIGVIAWQEPLAAAAAVALTGGVLWWVARGHSSARR